jgi:hypothetical protein
MSCIIKFPAQGVSVSRKPTESLCEAASHISLVHAPTLPRRVGACFLCRSAPGMRIFSTMLLVGCELRTTVASGRWRAVGGNEVRNKITSRVTTPQARKQFRGPCFIEQRHLQPLIFSHLSSQNKVFNLHSLELKRLLKTYALARLDPCVIPRSSCPRCGLFRLISWQACRLVVGDPAKLPQTHLGTFVAVHRCQRIGPH